MKLGGVFMMLAVLASAGAAQACGPQALGTARSVEIAPTAPLGLKTYPRTLALADKELVLTFDDGPLPATTTRVLDALKAECVQATFFVIGRNAAANPSVLRRALKDGHTIGHHSYTHPAITLRGLSEEAAKADIARGMEADDIAAYGAWSGAPKTPFFRFPGFADTPALNATLAAQGVTIFGADLWASDWQPMSADAQRALLLARDRKGGQGRRADARYTRPDRRHAARPVARSEGARLSHRPYRSRRRRRAALAGADWLALGNRSDPQELARNACPQRAAVSAARRIICRRISPAAFPETPSRPLSCLPT